MKKLLLLVLVVVLAVVGYQAVNVESHTFWHDELEVVDTFSNEYITVRVYEVVEDFGDGWSDVHYSTKVEFEVN